MLTHVGVLVVADVQVMHLPGGGGLAQPTNTHINSFGYSMISTTDSNVLLVYGGDSDEVRYHTFGLVSLSVK